MKITNKHIRFVKEGIFRNRLIKELYFFEDDFQHIVVPEKGDIVYVRDEKSDKIWRLKVKYRHISYTDFHSYIEIYCTGHKTKLEEIPT